MTPVPGGRASRVVLILIAGLAVWAAPVWADDENPIDTKMNACLATPEGQSTPGMVDCMETATTAWDARLNEVYRKAMKDLDPKSRDLLKAAQRQWLAFRAAEEALQWGPWRNDRGSIVRIEIASANLAAIKERVAALRLYADDTPP